jgi:Zn-dependent protease with chaperone function
MNARTLTLPTVLDTEQSPGIVLYAVTLAASLIPAIARMLIASVALLIVGWVTGWPLPANTLALIAGFGPLALSLLCLACPPLMSPISGRFWEMNSGGRPPEPDEQEAFQRTLDELHDLDPSVKAPHHWFVNEASSRNAAAFASSMRIDRGLLESTDGTDAPAVIAHELGHLNSSDARLTSALNILLLWQTDQPAIRPLRSLPFRALFWLASGQAALWFTANAWEMYWRSREYAADEYAARLGLGPALASLLEADMLPYEQPVPRMCFSRASHPYTKPRITRLRTTTTHADSPSQGETPCTQD